MNRSPLDELIAAERAHPVEPSGLDTHEGWRRIERDLAIGAAVPFDLPPNSVTMARSGLWSSTTAKLVIGTALLGGLAAVTIPWPRDDEAAVVRPASNDSQATDPSRPTDPSKPVPSLAAPETSSPTVAVTEQAPAIERSDASTPAAGPALPRTTKRGKKPAAGGIAQEVALVDDARRAVAASRFEAALQMLGEHAERFPRGALVEDRAALQVLALCRSGRARDGAIERGRFLARWPQSIHAESLARACDETNDSSEGE